MHMAHSAKQNMLTGIQAAICNRALLLLVYKTRILGTEGCRRKGTEQQGFLRHPYRATWALTWKCDERKQLQGPFVPQVFPDEHSKTELFPTLD